MAKGQLNPEFSYESGTKAFIRSQLHILSRRLRGWKLEWQALIGDPIGRIGLIIILLFGLIAVAQPVLLNTVWDNNIYDPFIGFDLDLTHPSLPSTTHPLGTDYLGRDVLSRVALATRTSFTVGILAAVVGTGIATLMGVTAAYYGGKTDAFLMTISDTFIMLPPAVVLLVVSLILDLNMYQIGLLFGIFAGLGSLAVLVKTHALSIMTKQHILAGRVAGSSNWRILRIHILPNLFGLMAVNMMFIVTESVMIEAIMSYLGNTQLRLSWGTMIWEIQTNFRGGAEGLQWHVLLAPAIAIMLFCGAFYMVARTTNKAVSAKFHDR